MDAKAYKKMFGLTKPEQTTAVSAQNAEIEARRPTPIPLDGYRSPCRTYIGGDGTLYFYRGRISNREREMIIKNEHEQARRGM